MTSGGQDATDGEQGTADAGAAGRGQGGREEAQQQLGGFRSWPGGVTARFAAPQAGIIRSLVSQVAELVGGDLPGGGLPGSDMPGSDMPGSGPASGSPGRPPGGADRPAAGAGLGAEASLDALLGLSDSTELPEDPVLARLLPDAYRDDPQASGEFRRYTERDLRAGKVDAARTVLATLPPSGGRVRLTEPESQAWLRALNDVRLALGVRLGVTEGFDEEAGEMTAADPRSAYAWIYQWLGYLQETLLEALS